MNNQYTLDTLIKDTHLTNRIKNSLRTHGITTVQDLLVIKPRHLKRFRNVGKQSLEEMLLFVKTLDHLKIKLNEVMCPAEWMQQTLTDPSFYPYSGGDGYKYSGPPSRNSIFDLMSGYATYVKNYPKT